MIGTNDLKSFIVTASKLHLTHAAKELGMSQPALSHCIKRIELELGVNLFLRRKNGLILTNEGNILFQKGIKICSDLESVEKYLKTGLESSVRTLSMGIHPSVASYTLPPILKNYPELKFHYHFGLSRQVNQWIQEGKIDCGVVINPYAHPNLYIQVLARDHVNLWVHKKRQNISRLFVNTELHQTHSLLRQLEKIKLEFAEIVEMSNLELMAKLVYQGLGVAILPERVIKNFYPQDTVVFSQAVKPFSDKICFVYSEENKKNNNLLNLKNNLIEIFSV